MSSRPAIDQTPPSDVRRQAARALRLVTGVALTLVLLLGASTAVADDDPQVPQWPEVQRPSTSDSSDPTVVAWPEVKRPSTGDASDPQPPTWPEPTPA